MKRLRELMAVLKAGWAAGQREPRAGFKDRKQLTDDALRKKRREKP